MSVAAGKNRNLWRSVLVAIPFFAIGVASQIQSRVLALAPASVAASEDLGAPRSSRLLRILSAGRVSAVVDALLIRVLTDDRTHWVRRGQHPKVFFDLAAATELDPWSPDLYLLAGRLLAVIRNDPEGARALLLRGLRFRQEYAAQLPDSGLRESWQKDWSMLLALFYVEVLELQDFSRVPELVREIAGLPGAPPWFPVFARRLKEPGHLERMGLRVLEMMLESTRDEKERRALLFKRSRLLNSLRQVEAARSRF